MMMETPSTMAATTIETAKLCSSPISCRIEKGVSFSEVDVLSNPDRKPEMIKRANGGRTVPQIFIGDTHVGGNDDLYALERAGKLDALLAG